VSYACLSFPEKGFIKTVLSKMEKQDKSYGVNH
jgi:hypothetical protein